MYVMNYALMKRSDLFSLALDRGIKYSYKMNKSQLKSMLEKNDIDPNCVLDKDIQKQMIGYQNTWRAKNKEHVASYKREYRQRKNK